MKTTPEINTVRTDGFTMDYIRFGSGEKSLVILPGISLKSVIGSADGIANAFRAFTKDYTVTVFDRVRDIPEGYTVADMADDTAQAMKRLGLSGVHIFGASQGGMIVQYLLTRSPERIARAVICSACTGCEENMTALLTHWAQLAENGNVRELNRSFAENVYSESMGRQYVSFTESGMFSVTPEELIRFARMTRACIAPEMRGEIRRANVPVLVIGDEKDKIMTGDAARNTAALLGAELFMYDGYSHAVYDEAPDFRKRMAGFFAREM